MANGFDTSEESYVDDDPVAGFDFDEATQSFDVASSDTGYGSQNIDTGGQQTEGTVLSQAGFNAAKGITATNPFGEDGFFTRVFGIDPSKIDYSGMGIDLGGVADLAYDRYLNPLARNRDGTFSLRPGLSAGEKTRLGQIVEVDKRMSPEEQLARTAFGLASPIGIFANFLGTKEKAIAPNKDLPGGLNYDPALDPNSPQYAGPQSFLGQTLSGIESLLTGGAKPISRFFQDKSTEEIEGIAPGAFDPSKKQFFDAEPQTKVLDDILTYGDYVTNMPSATVRGSQGIVRTNVAPLDSNEQNEIDRVMNVVPTDTSKPREKVVGTPINLAGRLGDQKFDLSNQAGRDEYFNFIRRLSPNTFS